MLNTREKKRKYRARKLCSEIKYQRGTYGEIKNLVRIYDFMIAWVNVAKKSKYSRPKNN